MSEAVAELLDRSSAEAVYITEELDRRPPKRLDYRGQSNALQDLAERMVDQPEAVLPRFVELAMELTGGSSAGLSLFEDGPGAGVFRWHHLCGRLAAFEGATTPRDDSPCGVTLDRDSPTMARHPERLYDWIAAENLVIPEVLLVPLHIGGKEPLGTLWIVADREGHFRKQDARVMTELARFVGMALQRLRVEEQLRGAIAEQEILAREMSHRVKNVFALTESMVRLTASRADSPEAMAEAISGRLQALADAHSLVRRDIGSVEGQASSADLGNLIRTILKPYESDEHQRIALEGERVDCGPQSTNGIALIIHELATNAAKYGALSVPAGRVDVRWRSEGGQLVIDWRESDGPPIRAIPEASGFGTILSKRMIERQFAGSLQHDWRPTGLACTMHFQAERIRD